MSPNELEAAKIIIPSISSFAGAMLAGIIAIVTSIITSKTTLTNSLKMLRHNAFSQTTAQTYQDLVRILSTAIRESRILTENERGKISVLMLWMDDSILDSVNEILRCKEYNELAKNANICISQVRKVIGIEK